MNRRAASARSEHRRQEARFELSRAERHPRRDDGGMTVNTLDRLVRRAKQARIGGGIRPWFPVRGRLGSFQTSQARTG